MRQRLCYTIIGLGMLFGVSGTALADFVYTMDTNNIAVPGPTGTATVHLDDSTHAIVTFVANTALNYFFLDGGTVAVNVNATTWALGTIAGNSVSGTYSDGGAGNEDGFGSFNQTINSPNAGPNNRSSMVVLSLINTSGTWANDMLVLIGNASGSAVAAHIGVCPTGPQGDCTVTGFTIDSDGGREQQVPEPGMLGLLAMGMMASGVVITRRRRV